MKKILCVINYYYPYVSGVSEYARLLCEEFVEKGYRVTVITSNHDKLPEEEIINGVKVLRAPIICKISKGTVSLSFILKAWKLSKKADMVNLHLPMLESGLLSILIDSRKIVPTYHCDVNLPSGILNRFILKVMDFSNNICLKRSRKIGVTSIDYMKHSRIAHRYVDKMIEAGAPIKKYSRVETTQDKNKRVIGFCGRIVEEKGIDVLLKAFEIVQKEENNVCLHIGGDYKKIAGGSIYESLDSYIQEHNIQNVKFLGKIPEEDMSKFYSSLDVFVLPSINSLEAFGMVQIEAMMCGTPVVASNLFGVRTIVKKTGMGEIAKVKDEKDLAEKILMVLRNRDQYIKSREYIESLYGTEACAKSYIKNSIKGI